MSMLAALAIAFASDSVPAVVPRPAHVRPVPRRDSGLPRWGAFYGIQTLRQLFPAAILRQAKVAATAWTMPAVSIEDSPRFGWRGLLLDVARHFMPKEFVKKVIDLLALHKLNRLQFHLTDEKRLVEHVEDDVVAALVGGGDLIPELRRVIAIRHRCLA